MSEQEFLSINTNELAQVKPTATKIEIPTFNLVPENHEILHKVVSEWDFSNPPLNANEFASSLVETCIKNRALGLSANQCGFNYRVFVAGYGDNYVAYFNPKVVSTSDEEEIGPEGCLSFPHLFLNVIRPKSVVVEYQDFNGEKHEALFEGLTARVFLHEYDHMEGIVFTSRTKPLALKSGLEKRNKLFHKMEKAQKQLSKLAKHQR
jgi:peptide deformylase